MVLNFIFLFYSTAKKDKKDRILIIRSFYRPGAIQRSDREWSNEYYNLSLTLKEICLIDFDEYFYDLNYRQKPFPFGDLDLLQKVALGNYKAIILSSYPLARLGFPKNSTFVYLREKIQIPIFLISWDSIGKLSNENLRKMDQFAYRIVLMDIKSDETETLKVMDLGFTPLPNSLFYQGKGYRDIDVTFLGSTNSYRSTRNSYIEALSALEQKGHKCVIGGGTSTSRVTMETYAEIYRRSKIVVNFSESVNGKHQIKGRVFEAIATGALLLESENNLTASTFKPYKDYVPFIDSEDLVRKAEFYLSNPEQLENIVSHSLRTYDRCYTSLKFWSSILQEIEQYQGLNSS